ncbi:MAG: hypothetical protein A4S12_01370 [Proteobacteria bacterium SG_bin5]|nr:MAG: hypothetical protein A4S12_01370 [Proteobacteria bacterium SG_bin5]
MRFFPLAFLGLIAAPVAAQDTAPPKPITPRADLAFLSDYRARGVSRSEGQPSAQIDLSAEHRSGAYLGLTATRVTGFGSNGAPVELQLYAGLRRPLGRGTADLGLAWTLYPGGRGTSDYLELTGAYAGTIGPLTMTGRLAYAPAQRSIGSGGRRDDNLYLAADADLGIPARPITINAHIGHSNGARGLNPNGFALSPTGDYWDWSLGATYSRRRLRLGVAYVDTDIRRDAARASGFAFANGAPTGVVTLGVTF